MLRRLPIDGGLRLAITTVSCYLLIGFGAAVGLGVLGFSWTSFQWLAAAVGVGLGFGLQEIFANFVSGLIILFERPIRVGDVITLGDVTGKVAKIKVRATTILDWDRKELIVPNKEFITGKLLNWSHSDEIIRVSVVVGIAYGSDTEKATDILLDITGNHPLLLADPPPLVTFDQFGDSTLNFTVRVFIPSLDCRLQVIHELHSMIHRRFGEAGIEIAFPQRDLHIRSVDEGILRQQRRLDRDESAFESADA